MTQQSWSSGLAPEKEYATAVKPTEPFWTENLLFAGYDPKADIGFWLHLGSVPNEWSMWEDRVILRLPGDQGLLSMWAYHHTPPERKPAGSNLTFECIEPYRRWRVTFDGFAQHISNADMAAGLAPDGVRKRLKIELDVVCATPVWDAQTSAKSKAGKGDMNSQSWAKEHYEQLWRATGVVTVAGEAIAFDGTGWRDHSRGPRGGATADPWGGHVILGCLFPSGRGVILSRYWRPDGVINLEGGCVVDRDGTFHDAEVIDAPRLTSLELSGESLPFTIAWAGGQKTLTMKTDRSIWTAMSKQLAIGKDLSGPGLMYVLNFGPCEWDGETGYVYIERSDPLNAPPAKLTAPKIEVTA
jgi:hypothetical protein